MLKKLNGKSTKFLLYIKDHYLGLLFKTSVLTTMLVLVYLVCILRQANNAVASEENEPYPIKSSQKLMLTNENEIPAGLDYTNPTSEEARVEFSNENIVEPVTIPSQVAIEAATEIVTEPLRETATEPTIDPATYAEAENELESEAFVEPVSNVNIDNARAHATEITMDSPMEEELQPEPTADIAYNNILKTDDSFDTQPQFSLKLDQGIPPSFLEPSTEATRVLPPPVYAVPVSLDHTTPPSILEPAMKATRVLPRPAYAIPVNLDHTTPPSFLLPTTEATRVLMEPVNALPISLDQTKPPSLLKPTTETTRVLPRPAYTVPFKRSLSKEDLKMFDQTTESTAKETTSPPNQIDESEEVGEKTSTALPNDTDDTETINNNDIPNPTPTPVETVESNDLFTLANLSPEISDNSQIDFSDETLSHANDLKESNENLFLDEDAELSELEPSIRKENSSAEQKKVSEEINQSQLSEEKTHSQEIFQDQSLSENSVENKMYSVDSSPIFSPNNLMNLFNWDYMPASTNAKGVGVWWPKAGNMPAPAPLFPKSAPVVKRHQTQANVIRPIEEMLETNAFPSFVDRLNQLQDPQSNFNRKLRDSMSLLERLFGNLLQ